MFRETRKGTSVFALAAGLVLGTAPALAGTEAPTNTAIVNGGGTVTQGNLKLHWTLGEAAAGPISVGDTTLTAGFQATFPSAVQGGPTDGPCSVFCNGFEN